MSRWTGERVAEAVAGAIAAHGQNPRPLRFALSSAVEPDRRALANEVWSDLARSGSLWSNVRLVSLGRDMHPSEFMHGRIGDGLIVHSSLNIAAITQQLQHGATLIYNHLHETSHSVQRVQEVLEYQIGARIWVQAYVTMASATAFGMHEDDHNFVALQLAGSKSWQVAEWSGLLGAGEGLFLRSGTQHGVSGVGELSLHLTIAFDWLPGSPGPGSRLGAEEFEAHSKVDRLGSGLPIVLGNPHRDPDIGLRFAGRVKPRLADQDRNVVLSCSRGTYRLDRRLVPAIKLLQSGKQIGFDELQGVCSLNSRQFAKFIEFALARGIAYYGT